MSKICYQIKRMKTGFVFLAWLMLSSVVAMAQTAPAGEIEQAEVAKKSAIELMTSASHTEVVSDGERAARVYRPKTPVYHAEHPANQSKPLTSKRHTLVTYSQENQGMPESSEVVE